MNDLFSTIRACARRGNLPVLALLWVLLCWNSLFAIGTKADNATALNLAGSFTDGFPDAANVCTWNIGTARNCAIGASANWLGISYGATGAGRIDNTAGQTLTLGASGVVYTGGATTNLQIRGALAVGADQPWTVTAGRTFTVQTTGLSGAGKISMNGAGIVTIAIGSTHTGGIDLSAGTLNINNNAALGTGLFKVSGVSTFNVNGGRTITNNNAQEYGADFTFTGGNTLNWGNGPVTLTATPEMTISASTMTIGGIIDDAAGTFGITKAGNGTLVLSNANTYNGATTLNAGVLTLSGANTIDGNIVLNAGTFNINNNGALGTALFKVAGISTFNVSAARTITNNNAQEYGADFTFTGGNTLNWGTGNVTLTATPQMTISASTMTIGGIIDDGAGTFGITKAGNGTLVLSGANTFNGGITMNAGTLTLSGANTFTGDVALNAGTININHVTALGDAANRLTIAAGSTINCSVGPIVMTNANPQTWNGNFTYTGTATLTMIGAITMAAPVQITSSTAAQTLRLTGAIGESGGPRLLTKAGAGRLLLSGNNAFSGGVTITGSGTTYINSATALGTGTFTVSAATSIDNSTAGAIIINPNIPISLANVTLTYVGTQNLDLGDGAVTLTTDAVHTISPSAKTLRLGGDIGEAAGGYSIAKAGAGWLTLAGSNSTFSGGVTLSAGTLNINGVKALGTGTFTVTANSAIDNTTGAPLTMTADNPISLRNVTLTFRGASDLNLGNGAVTLTNGATHTIRTNVSGGMLTIGGAIGESFVGSALVKSSAAGTLKLTGANTYTGGTTISAGTLFISNVAGSGTGSGSVSVTGGTLGGTGTISGAVTLSGTARINPGEGATGTGVLTISNNVNFVAGTIFAVNINGTTFGSQYDRLITTGTVTLGDATPSVTLGFLPAMNDEFIVMLNSSAVAGTFSALPEGGTITTSFSGTTVYLAVSYAGGDGNDVSLTRVTGAVENYNQWLYSRKVFLNTTAYSGAGITGSDLTNFPALIRLTPETFSDFNKTLPGGADVRFAKSDGTHLSYQIERWVDNPAHVDTAWIWVKVPTLSKNNGTQYLVMYYGKEAVTTTSNSNNVFAGADNYLGVFHVNDINALDDATSWGNNPVNSGATQAAGVVGRAASFNAGQYITIPAAALNGAIGTGDMTVSLWTYGDPTQPLAGYVFGAADASNDLIIRGSVPYSDGNVYWDFGPGDGTSDQITKAAAADEYKSQWNHWVFTHNSTSGNMYAYRNGQLWQSGAAMTKVLGTATNLKLGSDYAGANSFIGYIDEFELSKVERSAEWIKLLYENQKPADAPYGQTFVDLEDYATWTYSKKVGISTADMSPAISANVAFFPLLVRLDNTNWDFSQSPDSGKDIRFENMKGERLLYEMERYDTAGAVRKAEFWVLVDTVFASGDAKAASQYVTMYWGKSGVASRSNPARVFDTANGFAGVWHFTNGANDATVNQLNGVDHGTADASGAIGRNRQYNSGSSQYVEIADNSKLDSTSQLTFSAWGYGTNFDGNPRGIISKRVNTGNQDSYSMFVYTGAKPNLDINGSANRLASDTVCSDNTWYHFAGVFDGTLVDPAQRKKLFVNAGALAGTVTGTEIPDNSSTLRFGSLTGNASGYLSGFLDEGRVERVARSADWIKLCYETQKPPSISTVNDVDFEQFLPCTLRTSATLCTVFTKNWSVVFDKSGGAGARGGINLLSDSGRAKSSNQLSAGQNLFSVEYSGVSTMDIASGGTWTTIDTQGRVIAGVRQTATLASVPFTIDYSIQGNGKIFVHVEAFNTTGAPLAGKTLRFITERRKTASGNITITTGNATANLSPYVLLSCDSLRQFDPLLVPFSLWDDATGFHNSTGSSYAGYECAAAWGLPTGQRTSWDFMLDFTHKTWNDSIGVGSYASDYRNPDSLGFLAGTPLKEKDWQNKLYGHWKLDEKTGTLAYDNSGMGYTGTATGGTWTSGKWGGALTLTSAQSVSVGNIANLNGTGNDGFTVMAWIKPASGLDGSTMIFGKHDGASAGWQLSGGAAGAIGAALDATDATTLTGSTDIGTGTWYHVAMVCVPSIDSVFFFVNGVIDAVAGDGTDLTVSANAENVLIGTGFDGDIDDVRYYGEMLSGNDIRAIVNLGYRSSEGLYNLRADDNNAVHVSIDGGAIRRRNPVFAIENYWASAVPAAGCVTLNGVALSASNGDYICTIGQNRTLWIGLNKNISANNSLLYIDDVDADGSRAVSSARKMVWGKHTIDYGEGDRDWFWCKNFAGSYFGAAGSNEFYFAWKFDSAKAHDSKSRGGELYRFKSSEISPYYRPDTSADSNLIASSAVSGGTPLGSQLFTYTTTDTLPSTLTADVPTWAVVESSDVRIILQVDERALQRIGGGTAAASNMTTRWTIYPTGQIFRWDSLSSLTTPDKAFSGILQRYVGGGTLAPSRPKMRSSFWKAGTIHDNVMAFLGFRYGAGAGTASNYPWVGAAATDTITNATDASMRAGQWFAQTPTSVGTAWGTTPIQMAFYYDFQRDNLSAADEALYRDSVSNGVQCQGIAGGAALGMSVGTLLSGGLATPGDLNADGFNEREGAYMIQASGNSLLFSVPARNDTCRFYPVFHITNYTANQKPEYLYCYHSHHIGGGKPDTLRLIEGYNYNMYHSITQKELIVQVDSVFCDSAIFYISPDRTLAVELTEFKAEGGDGCDTVRWHTESESENLGYYLYRRIRPSFLDSISKAIAGIIDEGELDNAGLLAKRKIISISDTNWFKLNDQIIQSLSGGASAGPLDYKHIDSRNIYNEVVYEYRLESVSYKNEKEGFGPAWAKPMAMMPKMFGLFANYPNPFRSVTNIRFDVPAKALVSLTVFDLRGRMVRQVVRAQYAAGRHMVLWDGRDGNGREAAAGPYLYRLSSGKYSKVKMMMLVR